MNKKKLSLSTHVASLATTSLLNGRTKIAVMLGIGMAMGLKSLQTIVVQYKEPETTCGAFVKQNVK